MKTERWVDDRMKALNVEGAWQPDASRALTRFHQRRASQAPLSKRRILLASLALSACVCAAAVMEFRGVSASDRILKDRQRAPDFALKDSREEVIRLSSYRHKVVLLNFWATWCGGCQQEIPWLIDFETKYQGRGFTVIGVSMDEDGFKSVAPFRALKKMNYPVVIGNERLTKLYGVESMPETVLIDGSGKIAAFHLGLLDKNVLEREIQTLLN